MARKRSAHTSKPYAFRLFDTPEQLAYQQTLDQWIAQRQDDPPSIALRNIFMDLIDHYLGTSSRAETEMDTSILKALKLTLKDELQAELKVWIFDLMGSPERVEQMAAISRQSVESGENVPDDFVDNILDDFLAR